MKEQLLSKLTLRQLVAIGNSLSLEMTKEDKRSRKRMFALVMSQPYRVIKVMSNSL